MPNGDLKIQAWMAQLSRMRGMQYAYHKKFFSGLYFFLVMVIACLLWDSPLSLAIVPFLVVTAGTQSCFYLHFVDFARLHARHLEGRLNRALGRETLLGSEIEDLYFYPVDAPKIGGFVPTAPSRFFSFFTMHWVLLWLGLAMVALWRLLPGLDFPEKYYLVPLGGWAALHIGYLLWLFAGRKPHHAVSERLTRSPKPKGTGK